MEFKLELVLIPVTDVDRAKAFYTERAGFHLEVDTPVGTDMRVVQVTPPGSGVKVSEVRHLQAGAWVPGPDPDRANYESFADFADPDGNVWVLQEVNRAEPAA